MIGQTLTRRQLQIFAWMQIYADWHGRPPTLREVTSGMGLRSPNGMMQHVRALKRKGWIAIEFGKARAIRFLRRLNIIPVYEYGRKTGEYLVTDCKGNTKIIGKRI